MVLGLAVTQELERLGVTGAAEPRRDVGGIGHGLRDVRLVAFLAVGDDHFSGVRFVALRALRDLAMNVVALGTVQGRMLALVCLKHPAFRSVADTTGVVVGVY